MTRKDFMGRTALFGAAVASGRVFADGQALLGLGGAAHENAAVRQRRISSQLRVGDDGRKVRIQHLDEDCVLAALDLPFGLHGPGDRR